MANVLLLDGNDVAGRAMAGILARGKHRGAVVTDSAAALAFIREHVKVDLLILELKLKGENGIRFIERLRGDPVLTKLPVVVYTSVNDPPVVKAALALNVQNYLIKPYNDESIYAEVTKAGLNPWRNLHFEEERSFCAQMGLTPEELRAQRRELAAALGNFGEACAERADGKPHAEVFDEIAALAEKAEAAGVWGAVDCLNGWRSRLEAGNWVELKDCPDECAFVSRLITCHLNPAQVPLGFLSEQEQREAQEVREREHWQQADVDAGGPVVTRPELEKAIEALPGCPVIDTVAAEFQMVADGSESRMNQVMDRAEQDPGLAAQVLVAANRLEREDMTPVDDPRAAVGLLGEIRLHSLARVAVARLAMFTARYLEFRGIAASAYTAGLMHDLGKLILLRIHPHALLTIINYARRKSVSLAEAEQRYLGCQIRDLADHFAVKFGLPRICASVIRWVDSPQEAADDVEMVAVVSFARRVCLNHHVGSGGDTAKDSAVPLVETPAWAVLQPRVFPSFDLRKYEADSRVFCMRLRQELIGLTTAPFDPGPAAHDRTGAHRATVSGTVSAFAR
jgi:CheY-like chemotaxis protein